MLVNELYRQPESMSRPRQPVVLLEIERFSKPALLGHFVMHGIRRLFKTLGIYIISSFN